MVAALGALGLRSLQGAYEASGTAPHILLDGTRGGLTIRDPSPSIAALLFDIQDENGFSILSVDANGDDVLIGHHDSIISGTPLPVLEVQDATDSIVWWPGDRTFTTANGGLMRLSGTYILNYANVSFGALNLQATVEHQQAGFAFNHGLLFNHGNTYRNQLNVAANYGPLQGFIDQPTVQVNRTSAGAIAMNLFRSFLSQPRFMRTSTNGSLNITQAANFQGFGNVQTGATITNWRRVQLGPFSAPATGAVTNYWAVDIANETQPTTIITGIRCAIAAAGGGTRRNLEITGDALSTFAGDLHMNDGVSLVLGSVGGNRVELLRSVAGVLRMIGVGGTNNEGLDWDMDPATANTIDVQSSTGAGLGLNLPALSLGTTAADPTANWFCNITAPVRTITVGGDFANCLNTAGGNHTIDAALSQFAQWIVNAPAGTLGTGSVTTAANMIIQTAPSVGTNRVGLLISSNPSGGTNNYALWQSNAGGVARFDGRVDINRGIALGAGAAATLGLIGGSGPTAAAQAQWVEIDIGGVAHWLPAWT